MASLEQLTKQASKRWDKRISKAKNNFGKKSSKRSRKGKWGADSDRLWNVGTGSGAPKLWQ